MVRTGVGRITSSLVCHPRVRVFGRHDLCACLLHPDSGDVADIRVIISRSASWLLDPIYNQSLELVGTRLKYIRLDDVR